MGTIKDYQSKRSLFPKSPAYKLSFFCRSSVIIGQAATYLKQQLGVNVVNVSTLLCSESEPLGLLALEGVTGSLYFLESET